MKLMKPGKKTNVAVMVRANGETDQVTTDGRDFTYRNKAYKEPKTGETANLRINGAFSKKKPTSFYQEGNPKPHKIVLGKTPDGYTSTDVINLEGGFLEGIVRDALQEEDNIDRMLLFVVVGISFVSLIVSGVCCWLIYKIAKQIHVI